MLYIGTSRVAAVAATALPLYYCCLLLLLVDISSIRVAPTAATYIGPYLAKREDLSPILLAQHSHFRTLVVPMSVDSKVGKDLDEELTMRNRLAIMEQYARTHRKASEEEMAEREVVIVLDKTWLNYEVTEHFPTTAKHRKVQQHFPNQLDLLKHFLQNTQPDPASPDEVLYGIHNYFILNILNPLGMFHREENELRTLCPVLSLGYLGFFAFVADEWLPAKRKWVQETEREHYIYQRSQFRFVAPIDATPEMWELIAPLAEEIRRNGYKFGQKQQLHPPEWSPTLLWTSMEQMLVSYPDNALKIFPDPPISNRCSLIAPAARYIFHKHLPLAELCQLALDPNIRDEVWMKFTVFEVRLLKRIAPASAGGPPELAPLSLEEIRAITAGISDKYFRGLIIHDWSNLPVGDLASLFELLGRIART